MEEDSNHRTSQIIVATSAITVYNNTLRVRGRESGRYVCTVRNNAQDFFPDRYIQWDQTTATLVLRGKYILCETMPMLCCYIISGTQAPTGITANYMSTTSVLLEWTFPQPPTTDLNYVVYYQYGGVSYSESFFLRRDSETTHQLNNLPTARIQSISLVAMGQSRNHLAYLPSLEAGPISPGMYNILVHIVATCGCKKTVFPQF